MPTVVRSQVDFWLCFIASYENHQFAVFEVFEGNFDISIFVLCYKFLIYVFKAMGISSFVAGLGLLAFPYINNLVK